MIQLASSPQRGPSSRAVAGSALAIAAASCLIGAGGWSGLAQLKHDTQALIGAAASGGKALLQHRTRAGALPRGPLAAVSPAQPFMLAAANTRERERAVRCLANAVYYEAATEPEEGQRAVAQVVLNRVRDPNFPKSVCGVVYQGWERQTGCQFSFTCDGSLLRGAPNVALMGNAHRVAEQALAGRVEAQVGSATHYHADYVSPWWKTGVTRVAQIGAHIFYRWPGAAGALARLTGHYRGGELSFSEAVLTGRAARPKQASDPALDPTAMALKRFVVADASAPGGVRERVRATLMFGPGQADAAVAPVAVGGSPLTPVQFIAGRPHPTREQIVQMEALLEKKFPDSRPATTSSSIPVPAAAPASAPAAAPVPTKLESVSTSPQTTASAGGEPPVAGG